MAVTINQTDQLDYTWQNAPGTWSSPDAGKPWSDFYQQAVTATVAETLATAEALGNATKQATFAEAFATAEARAGTIAPLALETWTTSDVVMDLMNWIHNTTESFATAESTVFGTQKVIIEAIATLEALGKSYSDQQSEAFATSDAIAPTAQWLRTIAESWATAELRASDYEDSQTDNFWMADDRNSSYSDQQSESFHTTDAIAAVATWTRQIAEAWSTTDAVVKRYAQALAELWNTRDMLLRNAGGVVGDLEVSQSPMSLTDFANMVNGYSPTGFVPFKELVAGDYRYQDAIVWLRLQSERSSTDQVSITAANLEVDVPDQFDSGSNDIPAGGKRVPFSRTFNVVPDVQAQVVGGSVLAYPDITEIDETGFFVSCLNMANTSQSVEGVVSWKASGY